MNALPKTPFGWARATTAVTIKKNIADLSIPVLAKTAISVGVGTSNHVSTPRASVDMVKGLIGDDLLNANASNLEEDFRPAKSSSRNKKIITNRNYRIIFIKLISD